MSLWQAILLGFIQGLTEFLPVSSSGHLVIAQTLLGFETPPFTFDIIVHAGTLVAVIIFFIKRILKASKNEILIAGVATLPAVFVALLIKDYIEQLFNNLWVVATGLGLTATFLLLIPKFQKDTKTTENLTWKDAIIVGLFQAVAIFPGVSRSGSTVFSSLMRGLKREDAFYFSFLLSIPAIAGAVVLELEDVATLSASEVFPYVIGFVTSMITGIFALKLLKYITLNAKLHYFGYYCAAVSLSVFGYLLLN